MIIFIGMLISVISGVICTFLVKKEKTAGKIIHSLIRSIVMVNLISFMIMKYAFRIDDVYQLLPETAGHIPQFIISNIIAAIIWCGCSVLPVKTSCFVKPEEKRKRSVIVLRVIGAVLFTLGALALTATVWGKEFFGDLTPDQLIINLTSPTAGTDPGVYISGIENENFCKNGREKRNNIFCGDYFVLYITLL